MSQFMKRLSFSQAKEVYGRFLKTPPKGPESSEFRLDQGFEKLLGTLMPILHDAGYPRAFKRENAPVDQLVACALREFLPLTPAEASEISFWRYMNCEVLPWLVYWRWAQKGVPNPQRFFDRSRNYIGNLWWRAELFAFTDEKGIFRMSNELLEDDYIGILERPGMRGYRTQIQLLAHRISEYRHDHSGKKANDVIRKVVMTFRVFASAHEVFALDSHSTRHMIESLFADAENEVVE